MEKCRICLISTKRTMISLCESNNKNVTYLNMMKSLANIKVANDDGITNKICRACRQQLQEAYDFKILIERSDAALKGNLNKLKFDNINDIKMEIEINLVDKKPKKEIIDVLNNIDDDDTNKVCYGETAITKFRNDKPQFALKYHEQDDVCLKPVPVLEFLKSIPDETDNDNYSDVDFQDYDGDVCGVNSDDMMMVPLLSRKKTRIKTKHKTRSGKTYINEQDSNNDEFNLDNNFDDVDTDCEGVFISPEKLLKKKRIRRKFPPKKEHQVCIKPVMLKGLKLTYASGSSSKTKATMKNPIKKAKTVCPYCGVMTTYLHKHIQIHEGVRKYKCDKCEKGFFTSDSLKNHRKNIHGAKQLKCPECIMTFTCKMNLKSHMFKHSDKMSFVCDVCTKAFKRPVLCPTAGQRPPLFRATRPGLALRNTNLGEKLLCRLAIFSGVGHDDDDHLVRHALRRHILMHNAANKKVPCEYCDMTFYTKYQLNHHLRIHTRERPYNCEICSQPYSYKRDFNRHCLKKHGILLKRRSVNVMNEEVMRRERMLMKELVLRVQGVINDDKPVNPFVAEGPQAQAAFESAIEAIQTRQISIDFP